MEKYQSDYRSYLLRVWQEKGREGSLWRATMEEVMTGEQRHFASLEALFEYLEGKGAPAIGGRALALDRREVE